MFQNTCLHIQVVSCFKVCGSIPSELRVSKSISPYSIYIKSVTDKSNRTLLMHSIQGAPVRVGKRGGERGGGGEHSWLHSKMGEQTTDHINVTCSSHSTLHPRSPETKASSLPSSPPPPSPNPPGMHEAIHVTK